MSDNKPSQKYASSDHANIGNISGPSKSLASPGSNKDSFKVFIKRQNIKKIRCSENLFISVKFSVRMILYESMIYALYGSGIGSIPDPDPIPDPEPMPYPEPPMPDPEPPMPYPYPMPEPEYS